MNILKSNTRCILNKWTIKILICRVCVCVDGGLCCFRYVWILLAKKLNKLPMLNMWFLPSLSKHYKNAGHDHTKLHEAKTAFSFSVASVWWVPKGNKCYGQMLFAACPDMFVISIGLAGPVIWSQLEVWELGTNHFISL